MPGNKVDRIDWTLALILERKKAMRLRWNDIADQAGMSSEVLRKLVSDKTTWNWPYYTLKKVLQVLGVKSGTYTIKITEGRR